MTKPYTVMIVGMGKRGQHHATAFQANPRFRVIALCDIDTARLNTVAAKIGGGVKTGTDAAALAQQVKPDVFCFCTLPNLRTPMIQAGINAGVKLIAFEKPVALTSKELLSLRDLIQKAGVKAVVSHQHRYGVHYRKVKEIIASGALGRVHTVYGTATGWMTHMLSHLIDYTRWFNNEADAQWVMAQAAGRGKLADNHAFPLASHERTDLAKVTQFIGVHQKRNYACEAVQNEFLQQIARRLDGGAQGASQKTLAALLESAVGYCRANPNHPYRVLSELPASIYLNAAYEPLLLRVLKAEGKNPEPVFTSWRGEEVPQKPQPRAAKPTPESSWVYHVFGLFGKPDTMVLTEDDFLDYLIAASRLDLLLPTLVGQLMQSSLLFLGFRLDDWRFRVLFRMIVTRQGTRTMRQMSHVGVQIDPGEQSVADVKSARKYIESYFKGGEDAPEISIFWGSPADFLKQLREQMANNAGRDASPVVQGGGDDWY